MSQPLFLEIAAVNNGQSVASAGTFLDVGVCVTLDEAGLRAAGVPQADIDALTLTAELVQADGSGGFTHVSNNTLYRVDIGVWGTFISAPTVASGAIFQGGIHVGLSDDIEVTQGATTIRLADDAKANHIGVPAYFKRASS